jgi:hypothetical protein
MPVASQAGRRGTGPEPVASGFPLLADTCGARKYRFAVSCGQSGGDVVLVSESAEDLLPADPVPGEVDWFLWGSKTRLRTLSWGFTHSAMKLWCCF